MRNRINWDALGITTSILCAIHCAVLPLFLAALPMFGVNIIENLAFEIGMIVLAFVIGCYALWHGYRWHHHNKSPLVLFSIGIAFLVLKQIFLNYHTVLLIPAVIFIVSAHIINYRFCRVHNHAHDTDCNHDHY
ncbi:MerC domain-containing protein [Niabella sp. W65]|jgi:hypothetical protein|nr:MerC domain-containing protein [Niabella sp. W65]MCH7368673.1 MerC domain-containing protein [Niabella sp. W65]ULT44250.1 MerC domain-containing protein [Niabella sp. I65]